MAHNQKPLTPIPALGHGANSYRRATAGGEVEQMGKTEVLAKLTNRWRPLLMRCRNDYESCRPQSHG